MSTLNSALRRLCDLVMVPLAPMPPLVSILIVSLVVAVLMLLVIKRTSNQEGLTDIKRHIYACLFEIRLYLDDLRSIMRAQFELLRHNVTYVRLSLAPMVWIIIPLTLIIAQLEFQYGYAGLKPGEPTLLRVDLKDVSGDAKRPEVSLEAPAGVRVETKDVWIPAEKQLVWRIAGERNGDYDLQLRVGAGEPVTKTLHVGDGMTRRSPIRHDGGLWDSILYPAEDPLPAASPIRAIEVTYPQAEVSILGHGMHWLIPFFVLSMVFAFALRGLFKVTI
jgi:hypothetical protein